MTTPNISEWLNQVYNAKTNKELSTVYDQWAKDFDSDSEKRHSRQPAIISALAARYVAADDGMILDAGVGTGLIGEFLSILNYQNLIGIDFSEAMLNIAVQKGFYKELHHMTLGESLDFQDNVFAAVVAAGVFTKGHAPPNSFDELIRITRPGGYILFSVNSGVYFDGFEAKHQRLVNRGKWELIEKTKECSIMPITEPDIKARMFVYKVC